MFLDELGSHFADVQARIVDGPVTPDVTSAEIRTYLASRYDFHRGMSLEAIIQDVEGMLEMWQVQVTHPRYFGLFNPSVTLASVVADTLVAIYNPQLANWRTSPAANEMESHVLSWLASKFGLPPDASWTFTSGGSEANLSAVVVALTRAFPSYGMDGLRGLPASPTLYITQEAHHSFSKIAHLTGLGRQAIRIVATDADFKMSLADCRRAIAQDREAGFAPFMIVASAGTTAAGVIDPLPEVAQLCREEGLWFHVDAAWGGAAIISPQLKRHLRGIESADSITCDAHKWLSVPMASGMFFCRHIQSVAEAFRADVSYMPGQIAGSAADAIPTPDPFTNSVQWSRRFIGLKLFMSLAHHGESGYAEMVEHQARMGDVLRERLSATGWQIVNTTPFPLVCFTRSGLDAASLLAAMRQQQVAWMSQTELRGLPVIRACITSFLTTEADITWVVAEMNRLFEESSAERMEWHSEGGQVVTAAAPPLRRNAI